MTSKGHHPTTHKPRRRLPFWLQAPSTSRFHKPVASIIETEEEAEKMREYRMERLAKIGPAIHAQLYACAELKGGCRRPNCPCCARSFRLWRSSEACKLSQAWRGEAKPYLLTLIFREAAAGELSTVDLKSELAKLRVDLARCVDHRIFLIGGVEAALRQGTWSLHMHAVVFGLPPALRQKLALRFNARAERAVVFQPLEHLEQITYAGKFMDTFKVASPGQKGRIVPLPDDKMLELHEWWGRYTIGDFLFLYGFRIVGGKITPSKRKDAHVSGSIRDSLKKVKRASLTNAPVDDGASPHAPTHPRL